MSRLPQRPRRHVIEEESRRHVREILPPEWIVEDTRNDYGIDLGVEIVKNESVTGATFRMQLKGTDSLSIRRGGYISHRCKTSALVYYLERPELVVYVVYDAKNRKSYWIWIQDYIRQSLKPGWRKQTKATVKIPVDQILDAKAINEIARRVLHHHNRTKWLAAIETAQDSYFRYELETTETGIAINIWPRYPDALQDRPVQVSGTFQFNLNDPEGKAVYESLDRHFKTGEPVEIDDRFFEGFDMPEAFSGLLGHEDGYRTTKISIGPGGSDRQLTLKIVGLDKNGNVLTEVPHIDLREIQTGTEEITLENVEQAIPLKIRLRINYREQTVTISMRMNFVGMGVSVARDYLAIQRALTKSKSIVLTDLSTGFSNRGNIPDGLVSEPNEGFVELVHTLAFIQEKTRRAIRLPDSVSRVEGQFAMEVADILETGRLQQRVTGWSFGLSKQVAQRFADVWANNPGAVRFDLPDYEVDVLGHKLSLGPCAAVLPNAKPTDETKERLLGLESLSDDAVVPIELEVGDAGVYWLFHQWLPKELASEESN